MKNSEQLIRQGLDIYCRQWSRNGVPNFSYEIFKIKENHLLGYMYEIDIQLGIKDREVFYGTSTVKGVLYRKRRHSSERAYKLIFDNLLNTIILNGISNLYEISVIKNRHDFSYYKDKSLYPLHYSDIIKD